MTPSDNTDPKLEELKEKLAAIEHQRWSDWMEYMLGCAVKSGDDNIGVRTCGWPTPQFEHWQRQIETDYTDLSDKEKASDMEQVDRYWPLILKLIQADREKAVREARISELESLSYNKQMHGDWQQVIEDRLAKLKSQEIGEKDETS